MSSETMTQLYNDSILMGAKPLGASLGGKDRTSIDELKALTVEGYRTALSLTTEADLNYYFDDWKYRYGDSYIKFIKRRNDVYERIFGGFILVRNNDYIYKTNTLNIKLNLSDMINPEENIYMIEPGTVFRYDDDDTRTFVTFRRNTLTNKYKTKYNNAVANGTIPFLENGWTSEDPEYLNRPASFAEFKRRNGYDDKINVSAYENLTEEQRLTIDDPLNNKFTFINPFLIRFKRDPNLVSLYLTVSNRDHSVDFINQNSKSYVQFMINSLNIKRKFSDDKKFTITTRISPTITLSLEKNSNGDYINNLIATEGENSVTAQPIYKFNKYSLDSNDLRVMFVIYNGNNPVCYTEMYPTKFENNVITYNTEIFTDDHITSDGRLRLVNRLTYGAPSTFITGGVERKAGTYYELPKILTDNGYNLDNIRTRLDDELDRYHDTLADTPEGKQLQIEKYIIKPLLGIDPTDNDTDIPSNIQTKCSRYDSDDNRESKSANILSVKGLYDANKIVTHDSLVNMSHNDFVLIPKENVTCKIFTLYNKKYKAPNEEPVNSTEINTQTLEPLDSSETDNIFAYDGYFWTNEYATLYDPVTFIRPLNNVRSNLYFEDCTEETSDSTPSNRKYVHDINDVRIESVPFIKYDIAFDDDLMGYLMTTFRNQYDYIDTTIKNRLRNETIIDAKFYNTYGRSTNYYASKDLINDTVILLDTLNISITFDMWFVQGTDLENAIMEVKMYIKNRIESINNEGTNILHISNLMREIETNYSYVDHIRFVKINNYETDVQSLVLVFPTLEDMDKDTRRSYVPELITCDLNDIHINGSSNI